MTEDEKLYKYDFYYGTFMLFSKVISLIFSHWIGGSLG